MLPIGQYRHVEEEQREEADWLRPHWLLREPGMIRDYWLLCGKGEGLDLNQSNNFFF